jgi:uncharacterized protein YceH (UPF0502 family)
VRRLPRRPGQKEERWAQLLSGEPLETDVTSDAGGDGAAVQRRSVSRTDEIASLRADLDTLQEEVVRIGEVVEELRVAFDL